LTYFRFLCILPVKESTSALNGAKNYNGGFIMDGINLVIIMGQVTSAPRVSRTKSNILFTSFTVVTSRTAKGNTYIEKHNVVAFDKVAEIVKNYVSAGAIVYIEGRLQTTTKPTDPSVHITDILANKVITLNGWAKPIDDEDLTIKIGE